MLGVGGSLELTYFNQFSCFLTLFTMYCVSHVKKAGFSKIEFSLDRNVVNFEHLKKRTSPIRLSNTKKLLRVGLFMPKIPLPPP